MSQRRTALARLYEELRNIEIFDRIHDCSTDADPTNEHAYAIRQIRRKQILEQISQLKVSERPGKLSWVGSAAVFVWAVGYAMLYFLLK